VGGWRVAEVGGWGLWGDELGRRIDRSDYESVGEWNLGWAQQGKLAAMVENKADLVQPRGEIPPYAGRRTTVLDKYHRGEPSQTQTVDRNLGKISDLGK